MEFYSRLLLFRLFSLCLWRCRRNLVRCGVIIGVIGAALTGCRRHLAPGELLLFAKGIRRGASSLDFPLRRLQLLCQIVHDNDALCSPGFHIVGFSIFLRPDVPFRLHLRGKKKRKVSNFFQKNFFFRLLVRAYFHFDVVGGWVTPTPTTGAGRK